MNFFTAIIDAITFVDVVVGIVTFASVYVAVQLWQLAMANAEALSGGDDE